jgi:site-specific DNA-methyltransferase (adenine-specific)
VIERVQAAELDAGAFDAAEAVIERGQATFRAVGEALLSIREHGSAELRRRGYSGFEEYVRRRWKWSRQRGYQLADAAEVLRNIEDCQRPVDTSEVTEWTLRPLATLQPEQQRHAWAEAVRTSDDGKPRVSDLRKIVRNLESERKADRLSAATLIRPAPPAVLPARIEVADAMRLPLEDRSVDLIVTSPPYALAIGYAGGDIHPLRWTSFMAGWLDEAWRVAREGGRLALNIPLDTTQGGSRPTYAQAVSAAQQAGWQYRATVVWAEGNISKSIARGSVDSPSSPHVIAPVEMIGLFYRDHWGRASERPPDLTHEEWLAWTNGLWNFTGEGRAWEGHPAAFPEELPRRLTKLLSFPGDVVLDPFCGSGTAIVVAHQLGRVAIGFDISPDYVASARRRVAQLSAGDESAS